MEPRSGGLGHYRKWAGASPDQPYSVRTIGSHPKANNTYAEEIQPSHWNANSNPNSSSSQMMGLQMRMMQARQQNVLAHQRVADRILQNKQFDNYQRERSNSDLNDSPSPYMGRDSLHRERSKRDRINSENDTSSFMQYPDQTNIPGRNSEKQMPQRDYRKESYVSRGEPSSEEDMPETPLYNQGSEKSENPYNRKRSDPIAARKISEPIVPRKQSDPPEKLKYEKPEKNEKTPPEPVASPVKKEIKPKKVAERRPPSPIPPKPNPYIQELSLLAADVTKTVDANVVILGETNENRKVREFEKSDEVVGERRRKLRELLAIRNEEAVVRIPMWKHKLMGDFDPPEDTVLKGKELFQVIAWSMIVMFIKPQLTIKKRKIENRERERSDLARTLMLYADATKSWISKGVRFPVATLEEDATLDFEPRPHPLDRQISVFHYRMMQLKVRVKAIMKCISSMEMPPDNITDFLVGLVEEGNYFPPEFLWKCETDKLEFNSLGGVMRLIIPIVDEEEDDADRTLSTSRKGSIGSRTFDELDVRTKNKPRDKNVISLPAKPDRFLDVARVRMLLQNFVLIRILIGQVLLSPWTCSICRKPTKRKARIVYNCRMTATLVYEVVTMIDAVSTLPPVGGKVRTSGNAKANKLMGNLFSFKRPSSSVSRAASAENKIINNKLMINNDNNVIQHIQEPQSKVIYLFEKLFGIQSSQQELDDKKSSLERPRGEVEEQLLVTRKYYEPLPIIHGYLLKPATLNAARPLLDEWLTECSVELDEWMTKLVLHVLTRRAHNWTEKKMKKT